MTSKKYGSKEEQAKIQIIGSARKFLAKLGGNRYHPLVFKYLQEAAQDFHCDLNGASPEDLCFVEKPRKPSSFVSVKKMREFYNEHHPIDVSDHEVIVEEAVEEKIDAA
jgi:hypothetical protein